MFRKIAVSAGLLAVAALWFAPSVVTSANGQTTDVSDEVAVKTVAQDSGTFFNNFRLQLTSTTKSLPDGISDEEAAKIALARGAAIRAAREDGRTLTKREIAAIGGNPSKIQDDAPIRVASSDASITPVSFEVTPTPETAAVEKPAMWTVTGSSVNLRSGPGTNHAVITQARLGETYRPLSDTASDWIQIELADGTSAWIFAKFFAPADG